MKQYTAKQIRNIVLAGHGDSGKTSLAEAMLYLAKVTDRLGKIADGNTFLDFDPEEIKRKTSVSTAVAAIDWKDTKINIIDTPGLFDFAGGLCEGVRAAEAAVITVSSKSGVSVGTEKAFNAARKRGIGVIFYISKLESENADFYKTYSALEATFGTKVCPVVVPHMNGSEVDCFIDFSKNKAFKFEKGKAVETAMPSLDDYEDMITSISEAIAETDEELMMKYFDGEPFTPEEIAVGISKGVIEGSIYPVFCGDSVSMIGVELLLDGIKDMAPYAVHASEKGVNANGDEIDVVTNPDDPVAAVIFKTVADPFVGKLSYFKVISGTMKPDSQLVNSRTGNAEKVGKLLIPMGKKQQDTQYVVAGDIGAVAKLANTNTGDTLSAQSRPVTLPIVEFPAPTLSMAVKPKSKGDVEKIASGLNRLAEEDPTISVENNNETKQLVISGLGEQHLDVISSKLKSKFGVEMTLEAPKVAYRETIRKKVKVQGRHKKQSGGHGQFGDVWIEFEPCDCDDLLFEEKVFGGSVPRNFFPAVEKGLRDCIVSGVLAGYPMVGLKATLVDGSYHPVDSSEMSFKMAASIAYKNGIPQANPVILEPIGSLKVYIPDANMGDIIGDVNKRRGRVLGMNPMDGGQQEVVADVPMAEMHDFTNSLRQITQGRGSFSLTFERYEEAPGNIAQKVIEDSKAAKEE